VIAERPFGPLAVDRSLFKYADKRSVAFEPLRIVQG
jgi:hypothetical protein